MFDGITFKNPDLLKQAFIHRSYLNEHPELKLDHNERLEFLGDAVLELVVTEYLYTKFPNRDEGELTAYRAALVNAETLGAVAGTLGVNELLLLSKGEAKDSGRGRHVILANTFESIVGALYLDQGYEATKQFIARHVFNLIDEIVAKKLWVDAKSLFQEKSQEIRGTTPTYKVISETGPDHDKVFKVGLYIGSELVTYGEGASKQRAEQEAARAGLTTFNWHAS